MGIPAWTKMSPMRSARRLAIGLARRAGVYVTRYPTSVLHDEHIARILATMQVNCVIDVGAHTGDFGRQLRRIGHDGLIVSYEPVAKNFARLREAAGTDPLWRVRQLALGAEAG